MWASCFHYHGQRKYSFLIGWKLSIKIEHFSSGQWLKWCSKSGILNISNVQLHGMSSVDSLVTRTWQWEKLATTELKKRPWVNSLTSRIYLAAVLELLIIANYFPEQMEFAKFSWNCKCSNFLFFWALWELLVRAGLQAYVQSSFLALETAAKKTLSPQGSFSSCSGAFDHPALFLFGQLVQYNTHCVSRVNSAPLSGHAVFCLHLVHY